MFPEGGLELSGGSFAALSDSASLSQIIVALNEVINGLNDQLQLFYFSDGTAQVLKLGILNDGAVGQEISNDAGVLLASLAKYTDGTVGLQINDSNGKKVAFFGNYVDGSTGLKLFDSNGVGVAMLAEFASGGGYALKIAQSGVEVSTATEAQLTFDSTRATLQLITQGQVVFTGVSVGNGTIATATKSFTYAIQPSTPLILTQIEGGPAWQGINPIALVVGSGSGMTIQSADVYSSSVGLSSTTLTRQTYNGSTSSFTNANLVVDYYVLNQSQ